jgi:hypothetical protein
MNVEYTKDMIIENTEVEKVENYGRFENEVLKLSIDLICLDQNLKNIINMFTEDKFNELLNKERTDSYIEDDKLVNYFIDKNNDFDDESKFILIGDDIDAINQILADTILENVYSVEKHNDTTNLYYNYYDEEGNANIDILNEISEIAAGFILSAKHVCYKIIDQNFPSLENESMISTTKLFLLKIDTESFEESLQNI